jgi:hypothetical protein
MYGLVDQAHDECTTNYHPMSDEDIAVTCLREPVFIGEE